MGNSLVVAPKRRVARYQSMQLDELVLDKRSWKRRRKCLNVVASVATSSYPTPPDSDRVAPTEGSGGQRRQWAPARRRLGGLPPPAVDAWSRSATSVQPPWSPTPSSPPVSLCKGKTASITAPAAWLSAEHAPTRSPCAQCSPLRGPSLPAFSKTKRHERAATRSDRVKYCCRREWMKGARRSRPLAGGARAAGGAAGRGW